MADGDVPILSDTTEPPSCRRSPVLGCSDNARASRATVQQAHLKVERTPSVLVAQKGLEHAVARPHRFRRNFDLCLLKIPKALKTVEFLPRRRSVAGMHTLISALSTMIACRLRSRADLELEIIALRHQLAVLRRQGRRQPWLTSADRMLWVFLYRLWPRCLDAIVLVKPATVVGWHRQGFRLFWGWRSQAGRPRADREVRDLIRQMSAANPLRGAPRIHGELLKLGIQISQATVAKYMVRRVGRLSPTWRSFLHNRFDGISALDMFVVTSASFRLLYVIVILNHARRRIVRFDVTQHPTAAWLSRQVTEAFPWDTASRYLLRDRDAPYGFYFRKRVAAMGITEIVTAPRSP